jgi:hypothetical protein
MRTLTLTALILFVSFNTWADRQIGPDPVPRSFVLGAPRTSTPVRNPDWEQACAEISVRPFRRFDGQTVDMRPIFAAFAACADYSGFEHIAGKTLQVFPTGALITDRAFGLVFVENFPTAGLVDDARVRCLARPAGTYVYTSVQNARKTIPKYDFGVAEAEEKITAILTAEAIRQGKIQRAQQQQTKKTATELSDRALANQIKNATNGYGYAQYELGVRYLGGDGVEQNRERALHWLRAACTNGYTQASNKLVQIQREGTASK